MFDQEKVINGLQCCFNIQSGYKDTIWVCPTCPYAKNDGKPCETLAPLLNDALALLKAQEPRVLTLEEVIASKFGQTIWLESYFDGITSLEAFLVDIECSNKPVLVNGRYEFYNLDAIEIDKVILSTFHEKYKVKKYRFWSAKPTNEQRKAVKWDD